MERMVGLTTQYSLKRTGTFVEIDPIEKEEGQAKAYFQMHKSRSFTRTEDTSRQDTPTILQRLTYGSQIFSEEPVGIRLESHPARKGASETVRARLSRYSSFTFRPTCRDTFVFEDMHMH